MLLNLDPFPRVTRQIQEGSDGGGQKKWCHVKYFRLILRYLEYQLSITDSSFFHSLGDCIPSPLAVNDFLISYTCFWNPSDCSLPIFHTCCRSWAVAAVTLQQQPLPLSSCFGHSLCGCPGWTPPMSPAAVPRAISCSLMPYVPSCCAH